MDECKPLVVGAAAALRGLDINSGEYMAMGRGLHSSTSQLNLSRV